MTVSVSWRGDFASSEVNALHAAAFDHRIYDDSDWDWRALVEQHSLGWVVAREDQALVGFLNVVWDGSEHAWLQDVIVDPQCQRRGIGTLLVEEATASARLAGCEWLHVDFEPAHRAFYLDACGFRPAEAGLLHLR